MPEVRTETMNWAVGGAEPSKKNNVKLKYSTQHKARKRNEKERAIDAKEQNSTTCEGHTQGNTQENAPKNLPKFLLKIQSSNKSTKGHVAKIWQG